MQFLSCHCQVYQFSKIEWHFLNYMLHSIYTVSLYYNLTYIYLIYYKDKDCIIDLMLMSIKYEKTFLFIFNYKSNKSLCKYY